MEPDDSIGTADDGATYEEPVADAAWSDEQYASDTGGSDEAGVTYGEPGEATQWPMASPSGEHLRLSYPESGGFRYEVGPEPTSDPFAQWTDEVLDEAVGRIDTLGTDDPAEGVRVGHLQQGEMTPFDPAAPANQGKTWRDPFEPPGETPYVPGAEVGDEDYHGAMGRMVPRQAVDSDGRPLLNPDGTPQMVDHFVAAEEFGIVPGDPEEDIAYSVRVGLGGKYMDHMFASESEALTYAQDVAERGAAAIRQDSALPHEWPSGAEGNPVDFVRVFKIPAGTPFLRSGVAPQPESMPGAEEIFYAGGGAQTQLPYGVVKKDTPAVHSRPIDQ